MLGAELLFETLRHINRFRLVTVFDSLEKIAAYDQKLDEVFRALNAIDLSADFQFICTIEEEEELKKHQYSGLYLIEVYSGNATSPKDWIEEFRLRWMSESKAIENTPRIHQKRINRQIQAQEWMPLYIGKSRNISERLLQHKNLPADSRTYALKIRARNNILFTHQFRVKVIRLSVKNYDCIATTFERLLREKINPIFGRQ